MSVIDTVKTIKKVQVGNIVLFKIGKFIYSYGKDAYIISYIFKYKVKLVEQNIYSCAFPKEKLNNVMATLENKKINYIVLDRKNDYRVDEECNNKNLNKYDKYLAKAIKYVKRKNQIDKIYQNLINDIEKDDIENTIIAIKKVIDERRKV